LKKNFVVLPALVLGIAALAGAQAPAQPAAPPARAAALPGPAPTKVAIINVTAAILETGEGKKAAAELQTKFNPRRSVLEKKQADIQAKQDQMKKGSATMSDEAKAQLARSIDADTKSLQRDAEDLNADVDQEQNRIMQDLGNKLMAILDQYAVQNGIAVVLDVSNQQTTTVLWASTAVNITPDMVKLYDQAHPVAAAPAAARTPAPAPKPTVPATKKQ
jgi:outer membrane protein